MFEQEKADLKKRIQYYDNYGHRDKQQLKEGYSYSKSDGAEAVYHRPASKGRKGKWKNNGPNVPNTYIKGSKGHSGLTIYKIPTPAPAPPPAATPAPAPKPKAELVVLSDQAAEAIAYTKAYEDVRLPRQGDSIIRGDRSVVDNYDTEYELNLRRASTPKTQAEENAAIYHDNYKSAVSDLLSPTPLAF